MNRQRTPPLFLIGLVWLVFFSAWISNLGYPELTEEEAFVDSFTSQPLGQMLDRLNVDEPHPPIFYLIQYGWNLVGGRRNEFLVRFPAVALGLLLLSLAYRLGRAAGLEWWAALISVVWLGLNPQITYHVREARMYTLMAVTAAWLAVIALRFERLPRRGATLIAGAVTAIALLSHYFNVIFVGALALWGLSAYRGQTRRRWLVAQVGAWGIFVGWTVFFGHAFLNSTSLSQGKTWSFTLPPWDALAGMLRSGVFGYRDIPATWLVAIGGGVLMAMWLIGIFNSRGRVRSFLWFATAMPLVMYAVASWLKPIYHPKYVLPWLALAAPAIGWLITRRPRLGTGLVLVTIAFMVAPTWRTLHWPYYYPSPTVIVARTDWLRPEHRQFAEYLKQYADSTDAFVYAAPSAIDCYYANLYIERSLGCHLLLQHPDQSVADAEYNLTELLNGHTLVWYRQLSNANWDPLNAAQAALDRRAVALGVENVSGLPLALYTGPQTILAQQQPVGVRFGAVAQLEGLWLAQRGDLHVVLIWRSLADHPPLAAKVFVHLMSASGEVLAQMDNVPVSWTRPLATWQSGEQLLDVYALSIPPDASTTLASTTLSAQLSGATLQIGVYEADTGSRLPAYDRSGAQLAGNLFSMPLHLVDTP